MDFFARFSQMPLFQPQNRLALGLLVCGMMLFVVGLLWSFNPFSQPQAMEFVPAEAEEKKEISQELLVDVEGSVIKPGVYSLPENARIHDALVAAGGLSQDADRAWVKKQLNLAAKVQDGAKIYIPSVGENTNYSSPASSGQAGVLGSASSLININSCLCIRAGQVVRNRCRYCPEDYRWKTILINRRPTFKEDSWQ